MIDTKDTAPHDPADGCPEGSAEHWRDLYAGMTAECGRVRTLWMRSITEESKYRDSTYAAANRSAWEALLGFQRWMVIESAAEPLRQLVTVALDTPDKPSLARMTTLRMAADVVKPMLGKDKVRECAPFLDEMNRLHRASRLAGEWLHNKQLIPGKSLSGEYCLCLGCELTRMIHGPHVDAGPERFSPINSSMKDGQ